MAGLQQQLSAQPLLEVRSDRHEGAVYGCPRPPNSKGDAFVTNESVPSTRSPVAVAQGAPRAGQAPVAEDRRAVTAHTAAATSSSPALTSSAVCSAEDMLARRPSDR